MGYGANLTVDKTGPVSMLKANGSFGYNIRVTPDVRASFGLNLGFIQYRADGTQFDLPTPDPDPKAPPTMMANFKPDAGAGLYVYHFDWFFGASAQQLFSNRIRFTNEGEEVKSSNLKTHFYVHGGYKQRLVNRMELELAALARMVSSFPLQLDFNTRLIYDNQFWGGISARNTFESFNDLSLIFGYIHERRIYVSIAYDFTFANIRKYTAGTVELMIGYNFDEIKHGR
jgi:type IX secretion system PorP/SprF family membrane protein